MDPHATFTSPLGPSISHSPPPKRGLEQQRVTPQRTRTRTDSVARRVRDLLVERRRDAEVGRAVLAEVDLLRHRASVDAAVALRVAGRVIDHPDLVFGHAGKEAARGGVDVSLQDTVSC